MENKFALLRPFRRRPRVLFSSPPRHHHTLLFPLLQLSGGALLSSPQSRKLAVVAPSYSSSSFSSVLNWYVPDRKTKVREESFFLCPPPPFLGLTFAAAAEFAPSLLPFHFLCCRKLLARNTDEEANCVSCRSQSPSTLSLLLLLLLTTKPTRLLQGLDSNRDDAGKTWSTFCRYIGREETFSSR